MGALTVAHERAFTELLSVDVVRGPHSTGMASYNPATKDINIAKEVGAPSELIRHSDYTKSMSKVNRLLLGHNRYATKGAINRDNAHPFKQGHIIGAHNGSLLFSGQARLEDKDHKFGTDSEAIFWSISTKGFDETWRLIANPVFEGAGTSGNAFALIWFDTKSNRLNMVRNSRRPLFYAYTEKHDAVYWASEVGMLEWIMFRNGFSGKEFKVYSVTENTLYSWPIADKNESIVEAPTMTTLAIPEPLYVVQKASEYSTTMLMQGGTTNHHHHTTTSKKTTNVVNFPSAAQVKNFRPPYKNDKGIVCGKKFLTTLAAQGCFYCGEPEFKWGDFAYLPTIGGANITEYLCEECFLDNEIRQMVVDCSNA